MSCKQDITLKGYNWLAHLFITDHNLSHTFHYAPWESVEAMARACFHFTDTQLKHLKTKYEE